MFTISENTDEFFDSLNTKHKNIKVAIEKEQYRKLPFNISLLLREIIIG